MRVVVDLMVVVVLGSFDGDGVGVTAPLNPVGLLESVAVIVTV